MTATVSSLGAESTPISGTALIIGCGYLGMRVARAWLAQGRTVTALTRSRADELAGIGIVPILGDVLNPSTLRQLPQAETLLYAVGLDRRSGRSMREVYVDGLKNVLQAVQQAGKLPRRWIAISSTSVYGQSHGEVVTEESATMPVDDSGQVILEAEATLSQAVPGAVILRFAGIYGPGRLLRREALLAGQPLIADPEKWLNLIHVADGVRAILAAEVHARPGSIYNIADGTPVTRRDFYTYLAKLLNAPPAQFVWPPSNPVLIEEANRQISVEKARRDLSFQPSYPSYREGLPASLAESA